jgi:hypothetical protein
MLETDDWSDPLILALRAFERVLFESDATSQRREAGDETREARQAGTNVIALRRQNRR